MLDTRRCDIEAKEEWREWIDKIPFITFPSDWKIKVIPPFGGAIARFQVRKDEKQVSVYLDCYNALGYFDGPYWEIYPYQEDIGRTGINNTEELLQMIQESLNS